MRATWLADACRVAGLDVYEMPGWETRETRAGFDPVGVVCHHTATGTDWSDGHVAFLLRDGRRDLAGPLAQIGLERDGTVVLVAAGRANHNGYGLWGNDSYGIEAYNDGRGEPWPKAQLVAYRRLVRVICDHHGWGEDRVKAHRETDPDRKIDPTGIDMTAFRAAVFAAPAEEDEMSAKAEAQINRLAAIFGVEDIDVPMPSGLSRNAAERLDRIFEKLGAGRDGLSGNALARVDRIWAEVVADDGDVDESQIASAVLAGLTPEVIAAAVPANLAERVADELATRLAG